MCRFFYEKNYIISDKLGDLWPFVGLWPVDCSLIVRLTEIIQFRIGVFAFEVKILGKLPRVKCAFI